MGIKGLPDAAKQRTTDGAIAFVKYYVAVINEAYQHPQTGLLEPFALESCKTCDRWEQSVAQLAINEQRTDGAIFPETNGTEVVANLLDIEPPSVHVQVAFGPGSFNYLDKSGQKLRSVSGGATKMVFPLVWSVSGWRIQKAQDVAS